MVGDDDIHMVEDVVVVGLAIVPTDHASILRVPLLIHVTTHREACEVGDQDH